jgi:hypothetical protein
VYKWPVGIKKCCCTVRNYIQPHSHSSRVGCWDPSSWIVTFPTNIQVPTNGTLLRSPKWESFFPETSLSKVASLCKAPTQGIPFACIKVNHMGEHAVGSADCIYPWRYERGIANKHLEICTFVGGTEFAQPLVGHKLPSRRFVSLFCVSRLLTRSITGNRSTRLFDNISRLWNSCQCSVSRWSFSGSMPLLNSHCSAVWLGRCESSIYISL